MTLLGILYNLNSLFRNILYLYFINKESTIQSDKRAFKGYFSDFYPLLDSFSL